MLILPLLPLVFFHLLILSYNFLFWLSSSFFSLSIQRFSSIFFLARFVFFVSRS